MIGGIQIELDIDGILALSDPDEAALRAAVNRASLAVAAYVQQVWVSMAHELGAFDTGAYVAGIQPGGRVVPRQQVEVFAEGGSPQVEAVIDITNTAGHASIVEEGHGAFSLPAAINWRQGGGSIKLTAEGKPYLSIPFRHYTPKEAGGGATRTALRSLMPQDVYQQARRLLWRVPLNHGPVRVPWEGGRHKAVDNPHPSGEFKKRDDYRWDNFGRKSYTRHNLARPDMAPGFRLDPASGGLVVERRSARHVGSDAAGNPLRNPDWQGSKYGGMFKTGSPGHSNYMTIRTVTPDSEGWRIPAQAGYFVAAKTARAISSGPEASRLFAESLSAALHAGGSASPSGPVPT